jgi:hypothetical protein
MLINYALRFLLKRIVWSNKNDSAEELGRKRSASWSRRDEDELFYLLLLRLKANFMYTPLN